MPTVEEDETDSLDVFSAVMSNILLFFLIFGLSATVRIQDLRHQLTNKFAIFTGVAMQFLIMPFLGFTSVMLFKNSGFTEAMGISLLVVTASPGGSYSNWWCSVFNAELALSVAMTSVSSILSLGLLPANLFFYTLLAYDIVMDHEHENEDLDIIKALDFNAIFITLGVVLGAILLGLYAGYKNSSDHFHERANKFGSFCGIALILFSMFLGSGAGDAETNFWSLPWSFYVGTAFPCIIGITLANIISRTFHLSPPEVVAISIECCYQNTAIATSVAVTMFSNPDERAEAVSVPLFYGLMEAVIIGIYCVWAWKFGWTKAPPDEKICVVVTKTYEVGEDHEEEVHEGDLPKTWVQRLFIPRHVEQEAEAAADELVERNEKKDSLPRGRFESADVTVSTAAVTPPGTPDQTSANESMETILNEPAVDAAFAADLEMQTKSVGSLLYQGSARLWRDKIDEDGNPTDEDSRAGSDAGDSKTRASSLIAKPLSREPSDREVAPPADDQDRSADLPRFPSAREVEAEKGDQEQPTGNA